MQYKVESIGAQFSNKAIAALEERLTSRANDGYRFHSVFHVSQPGCLGLVVSNIFRFFVWQRPWFS